MFGSILAGAAIGVMGSILFGGHSKTPKAEQEVQMPVYDERAARMREAKKTQARHGRASTILSQGY